MQGMILELKSVVLIILICEFLKELLTGDKFKPYIQFAVTLFLFIFLLSGIFRTDFSLPQLPDDWSEEAFQNMLPKTYAEQMEEQIAKKLSEHRISYRDISVSISEEYELTNILIETEESPETIQAVLKGDFPYEVVYLPER